MTATAHYIDLESGQTWMKPALGGLDAAAIAAYWRDPYDYLARVLPTPKIVLQRGPKMSREARRARERDRKRRARAKHGG